MSSISSFDIISAAVPEPKIFLCFPSSVVHAAAVNPNGIKRLLAKRIITIFINVNPIFRNGAKILPKNYADCPTLWSCVFDSLISVNK